VISDLGTEGGVMFTLALCYWLWNKRYTTYLGYAMFVSLLLNVLIKGWVMECRPPDVYWLEIIHDGSFSFPSGHAQVATPLWFSLAYYVRHKGLAFSYLVIGLLIALSRPYLGVHFVHDVGLAVLLGCLVYGLFIVAERSDWQPFGKVPLLGQCILLIAILGIYQLCLRSITASVIAGCAALWGFWLGCQCETRWVKSQIPTTLVSKLAIMIVGIGGTLLLWKGPHLLDPTFRTDWAVPLRYIQYALLGFWITFVAPALVKAKFH
jgi:undecaprenyl-diphosphatase